MKLLRLFLFLIPFLLNNSLCIGQFNPAITPLHKFLQENHDSIIIYFPSSKGNKYPDYYIISKDSINTSYYTYINPYKMVGGYPKNITLKFVKEKMNFWKTLPDTNRYFLPKIVPYKLRKTYWTDVICLLPWTLKDDTIDEGCIASNKDCYTYDGLTEVFYLITKSAIKVLAFYEPEFFEKCCPGREDRIKAVKIKKIFIKAFSLSQ